MPRTLNKADAEFSSWLERQAISKVMELHTREDTFRVPSTRKEIQEANEKGREGAGHAPRQGGTYSSAGWPLPLGIDQQPCQQCTSPRRPGDILESRRSLGSKACVLSELCSMSL